MRTEYEARFVKDAKQEAKDHENAHLKLEERVCLALEAKQKAEEED